MAANEGFNITLRNLEGAKQYINSIARNLRGVVSEIASKELLRRIRLYPRYKYVTRKQAYGGDGFQSEKQRRFVMAGLRDGTIPPPGRPHRTMELKKGWQLIGTRTKAKIVNRVKYAPFVMGNISQSSHEYKVGWRKVKVIIDENIKSVMKFAQKAVDDLIRRKGRI